MNILSLPLGADTGGVSAALQRAFRDVRGWTFRSIISTPNYLDYPGDMAWSKDNVRHFWRWADVIHLHHNLVALSLLPRKGIRVPDRPLVVQYHGTGFREDPESHLAAMRKAGAVGLVSTLDLWLLAPTELEWLPCPI